MSADIATFCRRFGWPDLTALAPVTIAHRGARAHVSDNTLAAFRLANDLGAEMWELDLCASAGKVRR